MPRCVSVISVVSLLSGCAFHSTRDEDLERIEAGQLPPHGAVFIVNGIFYDLGFPWPLRMREELARGPDGRLGVAVYYLSEVTGVWFNWGSRAPGRLLAELADGMEELHRATGCRAPLGLKAVGFSCGAEVVLDAAARMKAARIERAVLLNSSSFAFSSESRRLVEAGKIGRILNGWSPLDLATIFAPLGAGQLGLHSGSPAPRRPAAAIENRCLYNLHTPPLFSSGRKRLRRWLLEDGPPGTSPPGTPLPGKDGAPAHTCAADASYRRSLAGLLRSKERHGERGREGGSHQRGEALEVRH